MSLLNISVQNNFKSVEKALAHFPAYVAPKVMSMTLNKTIGKARIFETEAVTDHYNLTKSQVTKTFLRPKKASPKNLVASQKASGRPIPIYKFATPSPSTNQGWKRPVYKVEVVRGNPRNAMGNPVTSGNKGFVAEVWGKGGPPRPKPTSIKDRKAYQALAKSLGGHPGHMGVFARRRGVGMPPHNLPIEEIFSIAAPGGMLSKRSIKGVEKKTNKFLVMEMNRLMAGVLTGKIKV